KNDRVAELVLGAAALKHKQYAAARRNLALSIRGPITDLTATLLSAWSMYGTGDTKGAVAVIDRLAGPEWYAIFKELHAGMIYDLAGNKKEAGKRFEHAYKLDATALRVVEAYGSWMSRNRTAKEALGVFEAFDKVLPRHPLVVEAMNQLKADEKLPTLVTTAQAGAFAVAPQCRDSDGGKSRFARARGRGRETPRRADQGTPGRSRSDHGAGHRPARA